MKKIIVAAIAILSLSACNPVWPPITRGFGGGGSQEHKPVCQHYWPDGHTGCNEKPGTG